jgi:hypothetical protein
MTTNPEDDLTAQRARFIVLTVRRERKHTEEGGETGLSCLALDEARRGAFYSKRDRYETSTLRKEG